MSACTPAKNINNIFTRNAGLGYTLTASEVNSSAPVTSCTANPAQDQGSSRPASSETRSRRNIHPRRRKSKTVVVPTSAAIPSKCRVSIAGNSHSDSRIPAPTEVCSSHLQNGSMSGVSMETPALTDRWEDRCLPNTYKASRL
ncbi:MAG: hypothetical protein DMG50_03805 [Acidobacteria bacterium]|nr:MAG: hypothetical protein DMG50_03805 [Acidobacteriota bacterium]